MCSSDLSMAVIAAALSFLFSGQLNGVREGTIIAALLVGFIARVLGKKLEFIKPVLFPEEYETKREVSEKIQNGGKQYRKNIIVIGRQYGSGGAEMAKRLGERLGLHVYDKEILKMTSEESGIRESYFHLADEKAGNKLLYRIIHSLIPENGTPSLGSDLISSDNLFRFQSSVIRKLAQEESCIIIGRCADYVLDGTENLVRLFVYAEIEERINKVREKGYFPEEDILKNIKRIDRERRDYYRYYTGKSWENLENYDLMINTTKLSYDDMVECVVDYLKMRGILAK